MHALEPWSHSFIYKLCPMYSDLLRYTKRAEVIRLTRSIQQYKYENKLPNLHTAYLKYQHRSANTERRRRTMWHGCAVDDTQSAPASDSTTAQQSLSVDSSAVSATGRTGTTPPPSAALQPPTPSSQSPSPSPSSSPTAALMSDHDANHDDDDGGSSDHIVEPYSASSAQQNDGENGGHHAMQNNHHSSSNPSHHNSLQPQPQQRLSHPPDTTSALSSLVGAAAAAEHSTMTEYDAPPPHVSQRSARADAPPLSAVHITSTSTHTPSIRSDATPPPPTTAPTANHAMSPHCSSTASNDNREATERTGTDGTDAAAAAKGGQSSWTVAKRKRRREVKVEVEVEARNAGTTPATCFSNAADSSNSSTSTSSPASRSTEPNHVIVSDVDDESDSDESADSSDVPSAPMLPLAQLGQHRFAEPPAQQQLLPSALPSTPASAGSQASVNDEHKNDNGQSNPTSPSSLLLLSPLSPALSTSSPTDTSFSPSSAADSPSSPARSARYHFNSHYSTNESTLNLLSNNNNNLASGTDSLSSVSSYSSSSTSASALARNPLSSSAFPVVTKALKHRTSAELFSHLDQVFSVDDEAELPQQLIINRTGDDYAVTVNMQR